jgi:hypothetical protein
MIGSRLFTALPLALLVVGLAGCNDSPPPPPQRVQPAAGGEDQPYPNLGTVPARPQTTTAADRAAVAGQLSSDRARARYGDDAQPLDETRGSTIGSQARRKPPPAQEPAAAPGAPPARETAPPSATEPPAAPR